MALPNWGAYIWRGLNMEGHIFGILPYIKSSGAHKKDGFNNRPFARWRHFTTTTTTGKNSRFPFLDTHKNPKFWKSETSPNQGTWLGLVSLCQIWDFCGYSLDTLKYPKLGICYFFLCLYLFVFPFIFKFCNPSEVWITKALICTRKQNLEGFWSKQ